MKKNTVEILKWVQKGFELGMFTENGEVNNEIAKQAIALRITAINLFLEEKEEIRREKAREKTRAWWKNHGKQLHASRKRDLVDKQINQLKKELDETNQNS